MNPWWERLFDRLSMELVRIVIHGFISKTDREDEETSAGFALGPLQIHATPYSKYPLFLGYDVDPLLKKKGIYHGKFRFFLNMP